MATPGSWNVASYERFKQERSQPYMDLLDLVRRKPQMKVIDLGCGPGTMTAILHERLAAACTLGIDNSPSMLQKTADVPESGLKFEQKDIEQFTGDEEYDLVFSNAAIQWTSNQRDLFGRIWWALKPGGQLAIQIPNNGCHPSQVVGQELARKEPYASLILRKTFLEVHTAEEYATWLFELGFQDIRVCENIYLHLLPEPADVVDWMKSSYLLGFKAQLNESDYERFLQEYRRAFLERVGEVSPYLLTFRRILMHAGKPEA